MNTENEIKPASYATTPAPKRDRREMMLGKPPEKPDPSAETFRTDEQEFNEAGNYDVDWPSFARALERENNELRQMLLKTTGCLGLLIGGAGRQGPGYKETYEAAKALLANSTGQPRAENQ